jgi:hypothetical protein
MISTMFGRGASEAWAKRIFDRINRIDRISGIKENIEDRIVIPRAGGESRNGIWKLTVSVGLMTEKN